MLELRGPPNQGTLQPGMVTTSTDQGGSPCVREETSKKYAKIQDGLESSISLEGRSRITRILNEVHQLSDAEKLLLYLKLPSGPIQDDSSQCALSSGLPMSNRKEQIEASTWIRSHLEEHGDVCMPKAEVYDDYRQYSEQHELRPLCNADFGKMMKQVFPEINTRRLGQRGQSRYFYGGLRKRLDHTPPTLPELEISSKTIEMDTNVIDGEIFKSSCQLVCEWADKVLELKLTSVQEIAEHLILKTFVNTKSVAALTLIAAMQESGKYNTKGVFGNQPVASGDKHRETNLLLARKLQQNKEIQKQKEKAQALREELQQSNPGGVIVSTSGSKTPVTLSRKSVTPSSMITSVSTSSLKSPRIPSTITSPLHTQSPQKFSSPRKPVSPWQPQKAPDNGCQSKHLEPVTISKCHEQTVNQTGYVFEKQKSMSEKLPGVVEEPHIGNKPKELKSNKKVLKNPSIEGEVTLKVSGENTLGADKSMDTNDSAESEISREAVTPGLSMDVDQSELNHVRKIDFDEFAANESSPDEKNTKLLSSNTSSEDKLSKSAGCLNLKTMLEKKDENKFCLNKSMGFLECSKNALFVNQSTIPGRSAFVPFSQVQSLCKRDNSGTSHSVAMAIPVLMPSAAQTQSSETVSQSTGIAMIAVPTEMHTSPIKNPSELFQSETILNLLPASSLFKPQTSQSSEITLSTSLTDATLPFFSLSNQTKESINAVTVSSVLTKMAGSDCIVSSAQSSQKQLRSKFTPIRPKASPSKAQVALPKEQPKTEIPAYDKDKRPVSAILKEKRAKEQAEAMAKSIRLSSIPFQPNISIDGSQFSSLQSVPAGSGNLSTNEVVIIVNNQPMKVQQIVSTPPTTSQSNTNVSQMLDDGTFQSQSSSDDVTSNVSDKCSTVDKVRGKCDSSSSEMCLSDENEIKDIDSVSSDTKMLSPMNAERTISPIQQEEDTLLLSDAESDANLNVDIGTDKGGNVSSRASNIMSPGSVDQMWLETPRKIQKLNITSPFQEECSFGRETPIRISKHSADLCSSRPESACSYGRETPSGARKRKSSDFQPRRDIKRLNSTGEDSEDFHNLSLVLSPENDFLVGVNPRRTQSCTEELDKDSKYKRQQQSSQLQTQQRQGFQQLQLQKSNADTLLQGLQSPDIHSLEREALIESFPNSLFAMKPHHKLHKNQSSSIGVNAKSMRQSQQKLIRQQQYLDERVKNFLQTKSEVTEDLVSRNKQPIRQDDNDERTSLVSPGNSTRIVKSDSSNLIVTDRGKPYQRPSSVATMSRGGTDMETSDLPSDVADWINEIMEQRHHQNQSAMSEPDCRKEVTLKAAAHMNVKNFNFEFERDLLNSAISNNVNVTSGKLRPEMLTKQPNSTPSDDNNFTVPKAPPVIHIRTKEQLRPSPDTTSTGQRCQSLPIFASPVQSPVSPMNMTSQIPRNPGNRAASMSPRGQPADMTLGMLSPTNSINSSMRRKETRENLATGTHAGLIHRDSKQGTYLASIQHSLQKPVDIPNDAVSPLDAALSQMQPSSVILAGKPQSMILARSRESSLDIDDRFVSQTPFSDSGYHSSGPSPILNSTPVSAIDNSDQSQGAGRSLKHSVAESPITMVTGCSSSPLSQQSLNRPQLINQQQSVSMATTSQINNFGENSNQLRSSIHSAFIPIQGSNNIRYVTPIKPSVTLPNSVQDISAVTNNISDMCNLYIDPNNGIITADVTMVSPHSSDPPSYEVAIKQLKKSTPPKSAACARNDLDLESQSSNEQNIQYVTQDNVMFSSSQGNQEGLNRPYSQKLIELSRHTQVVGGDSNSDKNMALSNMFMIGNDQQQAPPTYVTNQSEQRLRVVDQNSASSTFCLTPDQLIQNASSGNTNNVYDESPSVDNRDSISLAGQSPANVLNIDPIYQNSGQYRSTNQTDSVLPMMHNISSKLNLAENQLFQKPSFMSSKSEIGVNEFTQFQPPNDEISIYSNTSNYDNNPCSTNVKNTLIGGKPPSYELACDNLANKVGESVDQSNEDSIEDIGIPWESLGEIGKDFGDFNMF